MVQRYDKLELRKIIKSKIIIGCVFLLLGAIGFILIENVAILNNVGTQVFFTLLVFIGIFIISLIGIELRKISLENTNIKLEKYSSEYNTHIGLLYMVYLNGNIAEGLNEYKIELLNIFPYIELESCELEILIETQKLYFIFHKDKILYKIVEPDKHNFNTDTRDWEEVIEFSLNTEKDLVDFLLQIYSKINFY